MPSPVEALPCGSRSTISARWPAAASAVPRLTAVVVLPTPPFWLAIATMRARRGGGSGSAASAGWPTHNLFDAKHDPPRIGTARYRRGLHCPVPPRQGQFVPGPRPLQKQAETVGPEK